MNTAEQILVIFLSSALAIFLVLAITIAVMVVRLIKSAQEIADKAGRVVNTAESLTETLKNSAGGFAAFRVLRMVATAFMDRQSDKKK